MSRKTSLTKTQRVTILVAAIGALATLLAAVLPALIEQAAHDTPTPVPVQYSGRVLDARTGQPVANAKVTLEIAPVPLTRYTDTEGVYLFELPPQNTPLTAQISVHHEAYQFYERTIQINPQNRQIENIRLTPVTPQEETGAQSTSIEELTPGVWQISYFSNTALASSPVYQATAPAQPNQEGGYTVTFNPFTEQIPGLGNGGYSIRWVGLFDFQDGYYEFHCEHRDGCRTFLDGDVWIDAWWDGAGGHDLARDVSAGQHLVIIEFYDTSGVGKLELLWRKK